MALKFVVVLVACFSIGLSTVRADDATITPKAKGEEVTNAAVKQIQDSCVFDNDRQFLRRIAFVETQFGENPQTFATGQQGGIWNLEEKYTFDKAQKFLNTAGQQYKKMIRDNFGIDTDAVSYAEGDLYKALYSALESRVFWQSTGEKIPWTIEEQAKLWKKFYHEKDVDAKTFISLVKEMPVSCPSPGADVAFVVDSSASIGAPNYEKMRQFLVKTVSSFNTTKSLYRFAIVPFSDNVAHTIGFNETDSIDDLVEKIKKIPYINSGTNTGIALKYTREVIFQAARDPSLGLPKVIIVVTDGESNDPQITVREAKATKDSGIQMFSVGVQYDNVELTTLASEPICMHKYSLEDFDGLLTAFPEELKAQTCVSHSDYNVNDTDGTVTVENTLQKDEYLFLTYKVIVSEGITFTLSNSAGDSQLFVAVTDYQPTSAHYDFTVTSGKQLFLDTGKLLDKVSRNHRAIRADVKDNSTATVRTSVKGLDDGDNAFKLVLDIGDSRKSASGTVSFSALTSVLAAAIAYLMSGL